MALLSRYLLIFVAPVLLFGQSAPPVHDLTLVPTPTPEAPNAPAWMMPVQMLDLHLPSWLQFNAQYRNRMEESGHIGFKPGSDTYDLSQLRLQIAIQPVKWFRLVGETQDAAIFFNNQVPSGPPYQNRWDIRQAFGELGSDKDGWFDVIAGRQMLSFGDERVIGPSDWLNQGRTFDVARVDVHHPGFRTTIFASSVVVVRDGVIDHHLEGNNLYGIYNSFDRLIPHGVFEPYVLWRVAPANVKLSENAGLGALNEVTIGARLDGDIPAGFHYNVEMDLQRGSLGPYSIQSWAGHWKFSKKFNVAGVPQVFLESNHASGNKNPNSRNWGTFDQIYPSAHDKLDFADQLGRRNVTQVRTGIDVRPTKHWTLTPSYVSFWRASLYDGLYASGGGLSVASTNPRAGRFIGQELDAIADYRWNKAVELGFGYAHLFPGQFLKNTTAGQGYNYPFVFLEFYLTNVEDH
jgi:Alginate export